MSKIRVESKCALYDGISITFRAPCDSDAVDGLNVYDSGVAYAFTFRDAQGNALVEQANLFSEGAYVKVSLDTTNGYAYLQNADTNHYLEENLSTLSAAVQELSETKADLNQGAENVGLYWSVAEDGSLTLVNPRTTLTNGPFIITETQTLDLTKYGLFVGDVIYVLAIGGGGAGGSDYYSSAALGGAGGQPGSGSWGGGGGAGGGFGAGGGGAGGGGTSSGTKYPGGGGGGSGYISAAVITLDATSIPVTIGAAGEPVAKGTGGSGGTTSFGTYLTANGGAGGSKGSSATAVNPAGGTGGKAGGAGGTGAGTLSSLMPGGGGGGAGGWQVTSFTVYSATDGEAGTDGGYTTNGADGKGGAGGSDGGEGGEAYADGNPGAGSIGTGAVIFWC